MRTFEELKQILIQIKNNDYSMPNGANIDYLISDMLQFVGDIDSDLRESIYTTFDMWADRKALSRDQLHHILTTAIDDKHLFLGIGEDGTDTVFTRAFSSLLVCVAISTFKGESEIIGAAKDAALRYTSQEKDYRGYVENKGWAHAIAHAADMMNNIVWNAEREDILQVLDAISGLVLNKNIVYTALEDERLASAVHGVIYSSICERKILTVDEICAWLNKIGKVTDAVKLPEDYNVKANRRNFIKSLYFSIYFNDDFDNYEEIRKQIFDTIFEALK